MVKRINTYSLACSVRDKTVLTVTSTSAAADQSLLRFQKEPVAEPAGTTFLRLFLTTVMLFCIMTAKSQLPSAGPLFRPKPVLFIGDALLRSAVINKLPVFAKYELPRGAVFCRMEEKLRHKLNVWIKLRAGNDDMYRRLINNQCY